MACFRDLEMIVAAHKARYPKTEISLDKAAIDEIVELNGEDVYSTLLEWLKHDLSEEAARFEYKSPTKC